MIIDLTFIIRFLLAVLAVYRVAWFTKEDGPGGIFTGLRSFFGKLAAREVHSSGVQKFGIFWTLAEISNCPHCIGVWLAIFVTPAVLFPNIFTDVLILALGIAGLQSFLVRVTSEE